MICESAATRAYLALFLPLMLMLGPARPVWGTVVDDLCTGNPCVISRSEDVDDGSILDFGTRDVILQKTLDVGVGSMTLLAGSLTLTSGGQLRGRGGLSRPGGSMIIQVLNNIVLDGTGLGGTVLFNGADAGSLTLRTTVGSVTGVGEINLQNSGSNASGGDLTIVAGADIILSGDINLGGGTAAGGGFIDFIAGGNISVTGAIDVSGGQFDGGVADMEASGSVTVASVQGDGGGDSGNGGGLDILAGGSITVTGDIGARGALGGETCGDGGEVNLFATGDVTVQTQIELNGPGACCGGFLTIDGADVRLQNVLRLRGTASQGCGGSVEVNATGLLSVMAPIELDGGDGGGDLCLTAGGDLDLRAPIDASGRGELASGALFVELESDATLTIAADINASGANPGFGGEVTLTGCDLVVNPAVNVLAAGSFGSITLVAHDSMTVRGNFSAGPTDAFIDIFFGPEADPPDLAGSTFNIPPTQTLEPLLFPCQFCASDIECIDFNPCTNDICVLATGCTNPPNSNPCDDGNACTIGDVCSGGSCTPGAPIDCDDSNVCTDDSCDAGAGCINTPNSDCSDGNPCTDDVCDSIAGCSNPPNSDPCEDGDACTDGDVCAGGSCKPGPPLDCDDSNACTDDSCDTIEGCINAPNSDPCDDGDPCTTGDICSGGACSSTPVDCDDGEPCTTDSCVGGVCDNIDNSLPCEDGNPCTDGDVCSSGSCAPGPPLDCADGDSCTQDSCDPVDGCSNTPVPGCSDADGDQKLDEEDECTTLSWTANPSKPPNQHPLGFGLSLKNLASPGAVRIKAKGLFNVAPVDPSFNPGVNGVHVLIADEGGVLYEVDIPGGGLGTSACGALDGWRVDVRPGKLKWKYRNKSGALPPGCVEGSAKGIGSILIKDRRTTAKRAFQFKLLGKGATLDAQPSLPVRRVQFSLALAAQPSPGEASSEAITGRCIEALIVGDPVPQKGKPRCKVQLSGGTVLKLDCKGF